MDASPSWATPLLVLPGVALLILSTASRYARIHDELHHWEGRDRWRLTDRVITNLRRRARALRNALVALYGGVSIFLFGGLLGAFTHYWPELSVAVVGSLTIAASGAVLFASVTLIREAILSLDVIEAHFDSIRPER